jgi:cell division protein FtsL
MRKTAIIVAAAAVATGPACLYADEGDDLQAQILTREIAELRQKIVDESKTLESCAQKVKGFKIAGGVTLGLTAVGVGVNVYQAVGRNKTEKEISATDEKLTDAKKQLEALKAAKKMNDLAFLDGIMNSTGPLPPEQKTALQKKATEAKAALAGLQELQSKGSCDLECSQTIELLEPAIGQVERRLATA